ncbi:phage tail tube protein [Inquilinus sp.]|jgi:hypothetical protein|uniref:phage tail tube protein n=1 Tax=Inquilinus sp. TaxID=1932117 RepID=UPI003783EE58
MSEAFIGHGTILGIGDGATPTEAFTALAEVVNISGPGMSRDTPDVTHMASPEGWREFIAGLKDGGELTVELNHLPGNATHDLADGLLGLFVSGAKTNVKMTFPVTPAVFWILPIIVSAFEPDLPLDDKATLSATFKVAGKPTLT